MRSLWMWLVVGCSLLTTSELLATVPSSSQMEGVLRSTGGGPAADGDYAMTFALYGQASGGAALWTEQAAKVAVANGQFTWALGSIQALTPQVLAGKELFLGLQVGQDPELPRQPLLAALRTIRAAVAEALECSGCIGAGQLDAQVLAPYVKTASLAAVATSGAYADLSGVPQLAKVATSGAYGDLAGKPDLATYALSSTLADVAKTGSYADLVGLPVLAKLGTACGSGLVLKGLKADGTYECVANVDPNNLPVPSLTAVSKGLLTDEFTDTMSSAKAPIAIPDNNPVGVADAIVFPDYGLAKSITINLDLTNSDLTTLKVLLYDPEGTPYTLFDKGSKGTALKTSYPSPTKVVSGDLSTWAGKNPKGSWSLNVIDTGFLNNSEDGKIAAWSIAIATTSTLKVAATKGFQFPIAAAHPVTCAPNQLGFVYVNSSDKTMYVCNGKTFTAFPLETYGTADNPALSCKDVLARYPSSKDGLYFIAPAGGTAYEVYCDMTTDGGGWTLVASVHEDNVASHCDTNDRWSSTKGNSPSYPKGDGTWEGTATFGTAANAASDDFKSAAYHQLKSANLMLWHVPNKTALASFRAAAILRYYTTNGFLGSFNGTLYSLYKDSFPVVFGGACGAVGPVAAVKWDKGDNATIDSLIAPNTVGETNPGYISFRVFNNEGGAFAMCPGVQYTGCNTEHACIGSSGWVPEGNPKQCGDFAGWDWDGVGAGVSWSASKAMTEAAVLMFYR